MIELYAAEYGYHKLNAKTAYEESFGEGSWDILSDDQQMKAAYAHFNGGPGTYKTLLKDPDRYIFSKWVGGDIQSDVSKNIGYVKFNVNGVMAIYDYMENLGVF